MAKRFGRVSFLRDFGWLTLSFASGAPAVMLQLWFYLRGQEPKHSGLITTLTVFTICAAWAQWWKDKKAHERQISEYEAKLLATRRDWNGDWHALEARFEKYDRMISAIRWVADGTERWTLEGGPSHADLRDFQQLCNSAVALLAASPGVPSTFAERSRANSDDYTIWLKFVYDLYAPSGMQIIGTRVVQNGEIEETATLTEVPGVKKFSAMACQHCAGKSLL